MKILVSTFFLLGAVTSSPARATVKNIYVQCSPAGPAYSGSIQFSAVESEFVCQGDKLVGIVPILLEFNGQKYEAPMISPQDRCTDWPYTWYSVTNQYGIKVSLYLDYVEVNGTYNLFPSKIESEIGKCSVSTSPKLR